MSRMPESARRSMTPAERRQLVAETYKLADPRRPITATAKLLQLPRNTVAYDVKMARSAGILPEATSTRPTAYAGPHHPRSARWCDNGDSWVACAACRTPWPCPKANTDKEGADDGPAE